MYGSSENYFRTLVPPISYDTNEAQNMLPTAPAREPEQTPQAHIPVDIAAAVALQLSAVANNHSLNHNNELSDQEKLNYCSVPPNGLDYPPSCYPPPQSNSPSDYNSILLSRGANRGANNAFYPGNSWPYANASQDVDTIYPHPAGGVFAPADALQTSPYNAQFGDRVNMNASPYMMYSNGNADDLVERFNCVSLNDAMSAQRPYLFPASPLNQSEPLINNQWQQLMGKVSSPHRSVNQTID